VVCVALGQTPKHHEVGSELTGPSSTELMAFVLQLGREVSSGGALEHRGGDVCELKARPRSKLEEARLRVPEKVQKGLELNGRMSGTSSLERLRKLRWEGVIAAHGCQTGVKG
jgi:hypothetical protein